MHQYRISHYEHRRLPASREKGFDRTAASMGQTHISPRKRTLTPAKRYGRITSRAGRSWPANKIQPHLGRGRDRHKTRVVQTFPLSGLADPSGLYHTRATAQQTRSFVSPHRPMLDLARTSKVHLIVYRPYLANKTQ